MLQLAKLLLQYTYYQGCIDSMRRGHATPVFTIQMVKCCTVTINRVLSSRAMRVVTPMLVALWHFSGCMPSSPRVYNYALDTI